MTSEIYMSPFKSLYYINTGVFGCKDDADDPQFAIVDELPFYEQPSLPLEEMEKHWVETDKVAPSTWVNPTSVSLVIDTQFVAPKRRGPQQIDTGFFYCPYIPKLSSFWKLPADMTSTKSKLKAIGIDPAFVEDDSGDALKYAFQYLQELKEDPPAEQVDLKIFPKKRKVLSSR